MAGDDEAKVCRTSFDAGLTALISTKWHLHALFGGPHYQCVLRSYDNEIGETGTTPAEALWAAINYARSLD